MPTQLWAVRDALLLMFGAVAPDGVIVFDGPASPVAALPERCLLVGSDGGESGIGDSFEDGATAQQTRSDLGGNNWQDEQGEVHCAAWAWTGDTDFADLRSDLRAVVAACETALLEDRTLGGLLTPPGLATFAGLRHREVQTTNGALARTVFTVSYSALITT